MCSYVYHISVISYGSGIIIYFFIWHENGGKISHSFRDNEWKVYLLSFPLPSYPPPLRSMFIWTFVLNRLPLPSLSPPTVTPPFLQNINGHMRPLFSIKFLFFLQLSPTWSDSHVRVPLNALQSLNSPWTMTTAPSGCVMPVVGNSATEYLNTKRMCDACGREQRHRIR